MQKSVRIEGLTKVFGDLTAVNDLSLQVAAGEVVALIGPNGAGKTTILRTLVGALAPTSGVARILGHDCFRERTRVMESVGYVPDVPTFPEHLTGREIIQLVGTLRGFSASAVAQCAEPLIEVLDYAASLDGFVGQYSLGTQKKLALVTALIHRPKVLLLDELTNGLDPAMTRAALRLVRQAADEGALVLYTSHLLDQVEKVADRIAMLRDGSLVSCGSVAELVAAHPQCRTLEDVFFEIMGGAAERGEA